MATEPTSQVEAIRFDKLYITVTVYYDTGESDIFDVHSLADAAVLAEEAGLMEEPYVYGQCTWWITPAEYSRNYFQEQNT